MTSRTILPHSTEAGEISCTVHNADFTAQYPVGWIGASNYFGYTEGRINKLYLHVQ
jgi:hypothetical protein